MKNLFEPLATGTGLTIEILSVSSRVCHIVSLVNWWLAASLQFLGVFGVLTLDSLGIPKLTTWAIHLTWTSVIERQVLLRISNESV